VRQRQKEFKKLKVLYFKLRNTVRNVRQNGNDRKTFNDIVYKEAFFTNESNIQENQMEMQYFLSRINGELLIFLTIFFNGVKKIRLG
jgi:hypothetical protein